MSKLERKKWSENGVIVTVYEESTTVGSNFHQDGSSSEKTRRERKSQPWPCRHYDRRADLLAYAHHLRDMASQHLHQNPNPTTSLPKPIKKKRRSLAPLRKLRLLFGRPKEACRYQNIESRVQERKYRSCHPRGSKWRKLFKILRRLLREWSSVWKCNIRS